MSSPEQNVTSLPNGWQSVTIGTAEISISPDGLLMFPRHCKPEQANDWIAAIGQAAEIGSKVEIENAAKAAANTSAGLPTRRMILTEGPPPPGTYQLTRAAIGRPKRNTQQRGITP